MAKAKKKTAPAHPPRMVLKGLGKQFGGLHAVEDVHLELFPGDRKGIIGPNGAGKTTLFNLITGVLPASEGELLLFGREVSKWPTHRRVALGMARTFQITTLFLGLTVVQNVLLGLQGLRPMKFVMWRRQTSYRNLYERAQAMLEAAGFWERRDVEIRHLSHGEQRQVEILMALTSDPKILLLDEPAAGLSTGESHEMAAFLKGLDPDLAILMIEHDMDVAFSVVDTIAVLHYGKVVETGTTDQIRKSARVQEIYLGTG